MRKCQSKPTFFMVIFKLTVTTIYKADENVCVISSRCVNLERRETCSADGGDKWFANSGVRAPPFGEVFGGVG